MIPTHNTQAESELPFMSLARIIGERTKQPGDSDTAISGLTFFRREAPAPPCICMLEPSVVLVVQGVKQMWIGGEAYPYDASRFLITSLNLVGSTEVTIASPEQPCLGLTLKLDLRVMAEIIAHVNLPVRSRRSVETGVGIGKTTPGILAPFLRLLELLNEPEAIPVLAPLIYREIHYRLLLSDQSMRLRQIVSIDSQSYRIAKAIDWIKLNFSVPSRVEELAALVQMSAPTFHHHFRRLTSMSPLQYQKLTRLNEAKRLMLNEHLDVASAGFKVGYESPSQFSREYARLFGASPKRDIAALRSK
jgi:AraC-like DNA-binding protein